MADWLPRQCCNKAYAFWAYLRMVFVAIHLMFFSEEKFDVICDQISACIPVLRWSRAKIIFFCHFPDQLLTQRKHWLKKVYRWPIDWLEEKTTGMADQVPVNSNFTKKVFHATFTSLSRVSPTVLHPSLNFSAFDVEQSRDLSDTLPPNTKTFFLSINRYSRQKNLPLAIEAFSAMLEALKPTERDGVHLVMAGGYDDRVTENRKHYLELRALAENLGVGNQVTFLRSFTDEQKVTLLTHCHALLYTPSNEHFGICPLEGMFMRRAVVVVNSGGPLETVVHEETGFLCEPTAGAFAEQMLFLLREPEACRRMGVAGREHVERNFSFQSFTNRLNTVVME